MQPLTKNTKSYQYVKWGTVVAIILLMVLLVIVLSTDWLGSSYFSVGYLFLAIITAIRHRGNLYICSTGIILNNKFYASNQIQSYQTEKIIRWPELYGLNPRLNNAFKLTLFRRKVFFIKITL